MKRDGMKIGLLVVLIGASGILFYNQYVRTPKRAQTVFTAEEQALQEKIDRIRETQAGLPDQIIVGS